MSKEASEVKPEPAPVGPAGATRWVLGAGALFGFLTLVFFMYLVARGEPIRQEDRFLVVIVFAFGAALSSAFMGGYAAASGRLGLASSKISPVGFAVGGGVAVLLVVTLIGYFAYASGSPSTPGDKAPDARQPPAQVSGDGFCVSEVRSGLVLACLGDLKVCNKRLELERKKFPDLAKECIHTPALFHCLATSEAGDPVTLCYKNRARCTSAKAKRRARNNCVETPRLQRRNPG